MTATICRLCRFAAAAAILFLSAGVASAIDFPGPDPGPARAAIQGDTITLENNVLRFTWSTAGGRLRPKEFVDKLNGQTLSLAGLECFQIITEDSPSSKLRAVKASQLAIQNMPRGPGELPGSGRFSGKGVFVGFKELSSWYATLKDGASYVEQEVLYAEGTEGERTREIVFWDFDQSRVHVAGSVDGCPLTIGDAFVACNSPLAKAGGLIPDSKRSPIQRCQVGVSVVDSQMDVRPKIRSRAASLIGIAPRGQMRRAFLYYIERERAHPYRPFLHYNNGSEIGCEYWGKRLHKSEAEAEQFRMKQQDLWLKNIRSIGDELVKKRSVKLDAFVHDFEWDDETLVWQFHRGYPEGFGPAAKVAAEYGANVGVWFSPWGGYPCQPARIKFGREMGFETNPMGLSLAGPRYYQRFNTACINMVGQYRDTYFKFDGFGAGNNQPGAGPYVTDVEALLQIAADLRKAAGPFDLFINATTGSWPSPFWLLYVDSIWRQGNDTGMLGKGSDRQRWITYRDNEVYHRIVKQSPLFPLNSLMIHGVFVNELPFTGDPYDPKNPRASVVTKDVIDEIHTFFGTGTGCQEMYINPKLMCAELWDALAEAANWSRRNSDVLVDTHWIGGDPAKGEIYGFASWSKRQGILSLRNPDDKPAQIAVDVGQAFELPPGAPSRYSLKSAWKRDAARPAIEVAAGKPHALTLAPFESVVLEATPTRPGK
jgi:hypothetical protein